MLQNRKKIAELERSFASEYEPFEGSAQEIKNKANYDSVNSSPQKQAKTKLNALQNALNYVKPSATERPASKLGTTNAVSTKPKTVNVAAKK